MMIGLNFEDHIILIDKVILMQVTLINKSLEALGTNGKASAMERSRSGKYGRHGVYLRGLFPHTEDTSTVITRQANDSAKYEIS